MRVRVGVLLALAISGLFVPGSLSAHEAPPLIVTVQVDPPTGALVSLWVSEWGPMYPDYPDAKPIQLSPGQTTARFVIPAVSGTPPLGVPVDTWIDVVLVPDLTPERPIVKHFLSPCSLVPIEEPWDPTPPPTWPP